MIGWLIPLCILCVLLVLLLTPVILRLEYDTIRAVFSWRISWMGLTAFSSEKTGILQRMRRKSGEKSAADAQKKAEKTEKTWKRYWKLFRDVAAVLPKPLRMLWKGISIRGLVIGARVGLFDAKDCAVAYGAQNAFVYTTLGLLQSMMRVQVEQVQVQCAFGRQQSDFVVRFRTHVCPLAALAALVSFGVGIGIRCSQCRDASEAQQQQEPSASHVQETSKTASSSVKMRNRRNFT